MTAADADCHHRLRGIEESADAAAATQNQLRMRIKVSYSMNGKSVNEQTELNSFPLPPDVWT